ncbi:MAG: hypothetical protein ABEH43_10175 [Flavobacteriales bacterium]
MLSKDKKTLFFASNKKPGLFTNKTIEDKNYGGVDLFMVRKLPNGKWAKAQNLGNKVNTEYDEGFPNLSYDNKTLYFCSKGHGGMGGFDLFKSKWDPENNEWSETKNLGYPINTPEDNRTISFTKDGNHAYISKLRKKGIGELDIYKMTYLDKVNLPAIFKVRIQNPDYSTSKDSAKKDSLNPYINKGTISVFDKSGEELKGTYRPNKLNSSFTIALKPGKYILEAEVKNFQKYKEKFQVNRHHSRKTKVNKLIKMTPKNE